MYILGEARSEPVSYLTDLESAVRLVRVAEVALGVHVDEADHGSTDRRRAVAYKTEGQNER